MLSFKRLRLLKDLIDESNAQTEFYHILRLVVAAIVALVIICILITIFSSLPR